MLAITPSKINWRLFVYTRQNLLIALGLVGTAILIVMLAIWPQITSISETQTKLTKAKKELLRVTAKLNELEAVKISAEFSQTDKVNQVLPSKKPLIEFMTGLNSIAAITQVGVTDLKISPGQIATDSSQLKLSNRKIGQNSYDSLDLILTVSGELTNIQRFLSLIEQMSPITTITAIDLNREIRSGFAAATTATTYSDLKSSSNATDQVITTANLSLQVYYFSQQISASLTTALPQITARERTIFQTIQGFTLPQIEAQSQVTGGGNQTLFQIDKIMTQ